MRIFRSLRSRIYEYQCLRLTRASILQLPQGLNLVYYKILSRFRLASTLNNFEYLDKRVYSPSKGILRLLGLNLQFMVNSSRSQKYTGTCTKYAKKKSILLLVHKHLKRFRLYRFHELCKFSANRNCRNFPTIVPSPRKNTSAQHKSTKRLAHNAEEKRSLTSRSRRSR